MCECIYPRKCIFLFLSFSYFLSSFSFFFSLPLSLLVSPRGDPLIYDQHARCGKNSRCICSFNGTRGRIVEGYLRHFTVRGSVSENHTSCGKIMEGERGEGIARRCKCELKKVFLAVVESCAAGTCQCSWPKISHWLVLLLKFPFRDSFLLEKIDIPYSNSIIFQERINREYVEINSIKLSWTRDKYNIRLLIIKGYILFRSFIHISIPRIERIKNKNISNDSFPSYHYRSKSRTKQNKRSKKQI